MLVEVVAGDAAKDFVLATIDHESHAEVKDDATGIDPSTATANAIRVVNAFLLAFGHHPFNGKVPVDCFTFREALLPKSIPSEAD